MKVAFTSIFRPGQGGGEGRVAHELAQHFAREHEVVMICPGEQTSLTRGEDGLWIFNVRSAGETEFQMPDLSSRTIRKLFEFLDDFQPEIVHAHDPALVGLIGQVWARMNLVPFVHTAHILPSRAVDFGTSDTLQVPSPILKGAFGDYAIQGVLANFYYNCDALVALNQTAEQSIREFGYEGPVFIIPNGRALSHYNHYQFADNSSSEKTLVFVGFISDRKNQAYLLKVMRALPENYTLKLIGKPLNPDYQKKLEKYCKKHGLNQVEFLGQVEHDQIPTYLAGAHVLPSASKMEVQSLVVIEALASGTPVVGLSNETIDELIDARVGARLAKDQPPAAFAEQIQQICELPAEQYQQMCQSARQRVEHLDWSNVIQRTVEAYREIRQIKSTMTEDESDMLTALVGFLTIGDARKTLLEVLEEARKSPVAETGILRPVEVPASIRTWLRVPTSTWLISGLTVAISAVGYLFLRTRSRTRNR